MLHRPNIKQRLESMRQLSATANKYHWSLCPPLGGLISSILVFIKTGAPEKNPKMAGQMRWDLPTTASEIRWTQTSWEKCVSFTFTLGERKSLLWNFPSTCWPCTQRQKSVLPLRGEKNPWWEFSLNTPTDWQE